MKATFILGVILLFALPAAAQNSKGDRPAANPSGPFLRLPKKIFKSKSADRPYTRDIAGRRRIRSKNSSSASKVTYGAPNIYKGRKKQGDRPAAPTRNTYVTRPPRTKERAWTGNLQGRPLRVRSVSSQRARHNVYPQSGPYVNNPSRTPRATEHESKRNVYGVKIKNSPSGRTYGTRGRKDVYWGKFSKGEKPITKDLTGRDVRGRNFMSSGIGIGNSDTMRYAHKKPGKEKSTGRWGRGTISARGSRQQAWTGDVSGHKLRLRSPQSSEGRGGIVALAFRLGTPPRSKKSNRPLPPRAPGIGAGGLAKALGKITGRRRPKGGGTFKASFNNKGQPIQGRLPAGGTGIGNFRGNFKKGDLSPGFNTGGYGFAGNFKTRRPLHGGGTATGKNRVIGQRLEARAPGIGANGVGYSGTFKSRRPIKGGGSVTGKFRANGNPVVGKLPGIGVNGMAKFRGNFKRGELSPGFNMGGYGYSGNIKARRPLKGGGSVTGKFRANGNPVAGKTPGIGVDGMAKFRGNFKRGELSPGFNTGGYGYSGNIKARRPLKGGGSVTGKFLLNNRERVPVRAGAPGFDRLARFKGNLRRTEIQTDFGRQGYGWAGNFKTRRPLHGGGSVTGKFLKNNREPIPPRSGAPGFDKAARFTGNYKRTEIQSEFGNQGYGWAGNMRARKPAKGGGSISGKLLNNDGKPVAGRGWAPGSQKIAHWQGNFKKGELTPGYSDGYIGFSGREKAKGKDQDAKGVSSSGKIKLSWFKRYYVQNPKANDASLKKKKPEPNMYLASGLQVKDKQGKYSKKPHAKDGSLKGIGPKESTVKASEYDHAMKLYWSYKHNPSSNKAAMKTIAPKSGWDRATQFAGNTRMSRSIRHNPSSKSKEALKVFSPGKAYARINDFAGNSKMHKYNDHKLHPDAKFAHGFRDNVKDQRTVLMNIKLFWAKLFKKNDNQPAIVKEKERRPRYDKKEKDLWKALYD